MDQTHVSWDSAESANTLEYRAAGGVVVDSEGHVLTIERWVTRGGRPVFEVRLPKGHVEEGEADAEAALREVCEETRICRLSLVADLGEYQTRFELPDRLVVRNEHYYLMSPSGEEIEGHAVDPNSDEARFSVHWWEDFDRAESALTFESEREFVRRARAATLQIRPATDP